MFKYLCTGNIRIDGFGSYLEKEIREPRRNINLFVKELKDMFGFSYVTLVNSGSSANLVAASFLAEKLKKENKELTAAISAFTFPTTISSLLSAGFKLSLIDVDENSFNLSLDKLHEMGTLPSVICITHFLGFPARIKEIVDFAHCNGSYVLQDACETLGCIYHGKEVSYYGDVTTYSFYHPHHLSSYGGGAVVCNSLDDYIIIDSIAHWGRACKCHIDRTLCKVPQGPSHQFTYERVGYNVEMSELNACFGRWQLSNFAEYEARRISNYDILYEELRDIDGIVIWKKTSELYSPFVFPIELIDGRTIDDIYDKCVNNGVEIRTVMGGSVHEILAFANLCNENTSIADKMTKTTFFVGIHQTLDSKDVKAVAKILKNILKKE